MGLHPAKTVYLGKNKAPQAPLVHHHVPYKKVTVVVIYPFWGFWLTTEVRGAWPLLDVLRRRDPD